MADIDYGQIQRSVQDATANIRSNVDRLTNDIATIRQQVGQSSLASSMLGGIEQRLERIERNTSTEGACSEATIRQLSDDIADIKVRLGSVEKFALQFSDYLQQKFEEEKDDREYRRVG